MIQPLGTVIVGLTDIDWLATSPEARPCRRSVFLRGPDFFVVRVYSCFRFPRGHGFSMPRMILGRAEADGLMV